MAAAQWTLDQMPKYLFKHMTTPSKPFHSVSVHDSITKCYLKAICRINSIFGIMKTDEVLVRHCIGFIAYNWCTASKGIFDSAYENDIDR